MKCKQIILLIFAFSFSVQTEAQDLIYKKNGEIVKAKIVDQTGKSLKYKINGQSEGIDYFISTAVIDSIVYENGIKDTYIKKIDEPSPSVLPIKNTYKHNLIGLDLAGLTFYRNLTFSYEYLPRAAKIGFKVAFAKNVKLLDYYEYYLFNFARYPDWSVRLGINSYIFPPRTFRIGTGLYYLFSSFPKAEFMYNYSYSNDNPTTYKNPNGLVLNLFGFYNITENLAVNFGWDIPITIKPPSQTAIRCEVLLNF